MSITEIHSGGLCYILWPQAAEALKETLSLVLISFYNGFFFGLNYPTLHLYESSLWVNMCLFSGYLKEVFFVGPQWNNLKMHSSSLASSPLLQLATCQHCNLSSRHGLVYRDSLSYLSRNLMAPRLARTHSPQVRTLPLGARRTRILHRSFPSAKPRSKAPR